jgi:hypothetical protein
MMVSKAFYMNNVGRLPASELFIYKFVKSIAVIINLYTLKQLIIHFCRNLSV